MPDPVIPLVAFVDASPAAIHSSHKKEAVFDVDVGGDILLLFCDICVLFSPF